MSRDPALDAFPRLSHSSPKIQAEAAGVLLNYFCRLQKEGKTDEVITLGRRTVRGLACSKDAARRGYYLTLTGFFKVFENLSYADISDLAEKELKISTASSKGEEGDLWLGRVLFYGAIIRSSVYNRVNKDEKTEVIAGLIEANNKRSYLPSLVAPFLVHLILESTEDKFYKVLWPAMKTLLAKEWPQQTQHTLYLLLHIYKKFKGVKKTELKGLLGAQLLAKPNWSHVSRLVLEGVHPLGALLAEHLSPSEAAEFWAEHVQEQLSKCSKARSIAGLNLLKSLLEAADDNTLPNLVSASVVNLLKKSSQDNDLRSEAGEVMEALATKIKASSDTVRAKVLETLTAEDFSFDQVTKCGLVKAVTSSLEAEGLKMSVDMCKKIISDDQKKNKDKCGALQMIATLAVGTAAPAEVREDASVFLLEQAFFCNNATSVLSQAAKKNFTRCLKNAPMPVLRALISNVDSQLKKTKKPVKLDKVAATAWKKMSTEVSKMEKSEGKVEAVLVQLMVHLGLQLLVEPTSAIEALDELYECCQRIVGGKQDKHWAEVVVELLLSLLAHPSAALRQTVRKVFAALCPLITQQALESLVEACTAQDNPLVPNDQEDSEEDEEEEIEQEVVENGGQSEEEEEEEEEVEDEEESEDEVEEDGDEMEDNAVDRIRAAVRSALGTGGEVSDCESIDVDDISEEEGKRIDEALSQAFKGVRKGMSKKESQEQQQVLHFRLRLLDLVEVYISSENSLHLTLGLTGPLLGLLERCIKDQQLRPIEGRLRHILAMFGGLRRFKNVADVTEEDLAETLSSILVHGQRTQAVFLAVAAEAAALAAFLARASQQIEGSGALTKVFTSAAQDFLSKRDCVLPAAFFVPLLKTSWPGNLQLWKLFAEAAFDDDDKVRSFRRPQALSFLHELATNHHLRTSHSTEVTKLLGQVAKNASTALTSATPSQRFERQLLHMLAQVAPRLDAKQKETLADALRAHVPNVTNSGKENKRAFRKLAKMFKIPFNEQAKSEVQDKEEDAAVVVNGHAGGKNKKTKNQKKKEKKQAKKRNANEDKMAKKAAKRLRMAAASEGLNGVSFAGFANVHFENTDD